MFHQTTRNTEEWAVFLIRSSMQKRTVFQGLILLNSDSEGAQKRALRGKGWSSNAFNLLLQGSIPFAVIGSNNVTDVRGKQVRVRQYPWGMAEGN